MGFLFLAAPMAKAAEEAPGAEDEAEKPAFWDNFSAYEPAYFLYGSDPANAKIQFSFRYRVIGRQAEMPDELAWLRKVHVAYTQTSFWNLSEESLPFTDSMFKPELHFRTAVMEERPGRGPDIDFQTGFAHESNGKGGAESRSFNILYVEPEFEWGADEEFHIAIAPRGWFYVGSRSDNPDIDRFRGHVSLAARVGWRKGLEAAFLGRLGDGLDKGSFEVNLSYPLSRLVWEGISLYLHGQLFTGYGENLLHYNEKTTRLRIGISLLR